LLGALAEILFLFRRIDLVETDFGLSVAGIQNGQGVAIGNADDFTGEGFDLGEYRQDQESRAMRFMML
jgi:hypothetical protein